MRLLVDAEGVGRDGEDGQAHEEGQGGGADAGAVEGADGAHLGLEVAVVGVGLEGGGRALGAGALLHGFYVVWVFVVVEWVLVGWLDPEHYSRGDEGMNGYQPEESRESSKQCNTTTPREETKQMVETKQPGTRKQPHTDFNKKAGTRVSTGGQVSRY